MPVVSAGAVLDDRLVPDASAFAGEGNGDRSEGWVSGALSWSTVTSGCWRIFSGRTSFSHSVTNTAILAVMFTFLFR
jgi:hypothetical protein